MDSVSRFDGLAARSLELFGRPVAELSADELTRLYQDRGIMPARRPNLSLIKGGDTPTVTPELDV